MALDVFGMMPAHVRQGLTREVLMQKLHGVCDGDPCWSCGCEIDTLDVYSSTCPHCSAWLPRRCNSEGCGTYVHPAGSSEYDEPHHLCRGCSRADTSQSRAEMLDVIPQSVLKPAVSDYWKLPHREDLDRRVAAWIKGGGTFPNLYIKGPCGTGKTVAAARAAHFLVTRGRVDGIMWCREYELVQWAKSRWKNDGIGESKIKRAAEVDLLIVDEMFFRPNNEGNYHTEKERAALADLFCKRFEDIAKRTIMVSNERPMFSGVYDRRAMSRFEGSAEYIEVKGEDLRRRRG